MPYDLRNRNKLINKNEKEEEENSGDFSCGFRVGFNFAHSTGARAQDPNDDADCDNIYESIEMNFRFIARFMCPTTKNGDVISIRVFVVLSPMRYSPIRLTSVIGCVLAAQIHTTEQKPIIV